MRGWLIGLCCFLWPLQAFALCDGPDYLQSLNAEDRARIDAIVADTPYSKGLFWQAQRDETTLSIIGTMHIYDPRLGPIATRMAPLVEAADLLLVEAGPEEEARMQDALSSDPGLIFIIDGPTLPEQLPEPAWQALVEAAAARQIPAFVAAKMQPWYLALTLAIPACTMPDLAAGARGLDHLLIGLATDADVPIAAVEPWDTLFTLMQDGSAAEQLEMLQLGLVPSDVQTALFVSMLNSYFAENVVEIWESSRLASRSVPGLSPDRAEFLFAETEQAVLIDRNLAWIPRIAAAAQDNDAIVLAVGAAHLPGSSGILNLLAEAGWTITPLAAP